MHEQQMTIAYKENVNLEEDIKLRLSEMLSFAPECFSFNYKKQGDKAVVNYKTDEDSSRQELLNKSEKARNISLLMFLGILGLIALINFVVLKVKDDLVMKTLLTRQKAYNSQFHLKQELVISREIKLANKKLLDKIYSFLQQPLKIERIYVDDNKVELEGAISKSDMDFFGEKLQEQGLLQMSYFTDMGDMLWVLIKNY